MREYIAAKLTTDEKFQTQFRFSSYYASILIRAQQMQNNNEKNHYLNALTLIDAEWDNITAGQKWAAEHIDDDRITELCTDYSGYAGDFVKLRLHPRQDIEWLKFGLKAARKLNNRSVEGISLGDLGNAYDSLGDYRKAIDYHEQSLAIAREIGDRSGEGSSLGNLGNAYDSLGNYRKAIDYHEQSLAIAREIGNRSGEGISLGNLGLAYDSLRELEKACSLWKEALAIFEAIESPTADVVRGWIKEYCED